MFGFLAFSSVQMELMVVMFKLRLFMMVLFSLEFNVGSGSPPSLGSRRLYHFKSSPLKVMKVPRYALKEPVSRSSVRIRTVSVMCYPAYMEVRVKADLFDMGMHVDLADLRLGLNSLPGLSCGLTSASDEEYMIRLPLTDCGTERLVTEDSLIYSNNLVYSPAPSLDGLVRMESAVIPVKCRYRRRVDIDSDPVLPTWIPHQTTTSALEKLLFTLRLMSGDWRAVRGSGVYYLGNEINIEAGVYSPQKNLRLFIDGCVATMTPDPESVPRYNFISNNGCFVDSQLASSNSRFLPRERPDKLQLLLDAFVFHQVENSQIFITCTLKAYPVDYASPSMSKACSVIQNSWRSVDGDDWTCSSCDNRNQTVQSNPLWWNQAVPTYHPKAKSTKPPHSLGEHNGVDGWDNSIFTGSQKKPAVAWKNLWSSQKKGSSSTALEQEMTIGPLSVLSKRNKLSLVVPPRVKDGIHLSSLRRKTPIPHNSLWRNEEHYRTESLLIPTLRTPEGDVSTVHPLLDSSITVRNQELSTNSGSWDSAIQ